MSSAGKAMTNKKRGQPKRKPKTSLDPPYNINHTNEDYNSKTLLVDNIQENEHAVEVARIAYRAAENFNSTETQKNISTNENPYPLTCSPVVEFQDIASDLPDLVVSPRNDYNSENLIWTLPTQDTQLFSKKIQNSNSSQDSAKTGHFSKENFDLFMIEVPNEDAALRRYLNGLRGYDTNLDLILRMHANQFKILQKIQLLETTSATKRKPEDLLHPRHLSKAKAHFYMAINNLERPRVSSATSELIADLVVHEFPSMSSSDRIELKFNVSKWCSTSILSRQASMRSWLEPSSDIHHCVKCFGRKIKDYDVSEVLWLIARMVCVVFSCICFTH
jgi:hypothetical protein